MNERRIVEGHKYGPGAFSLEDRLFSWSAYNTWVKSGKNDFWQKFIGGDAEQMNPRMMTGRIVDEMMNSDEEQLDPLLEHLRVFAPHPQFKQPEIVVPFRNITLIMHLDGLNLDPIKLFELKTGVMWTPEMVAKHEQLDWYVLGLHLKYGVKPEDIPICLTWIPTEWDRLSTLPKPTGEIVNLETKRTTMDMIRIGKKIMTAWKEIEEFSKAELDALGLA